MRHNKHMNLPTLAAAALLLAACTSNELQSEYAEASAAMENCVEQLRLAVRQSSCAKISRISCRSDEESEYPVPQEEYVQLRGILLHTAPVPPALETDADLPPEFPCIVELVFSDDRGAELTGIVINYDRWMCRSEAAKLHPEISRPWDTPDWSLPDAELATLHSLPCMQRAKQLSRY